MKMDGRARVVGDDVNTDYIISSTRKRETIDETVLARYLLEAVNPAFAASVKPDDLLVTGRNFGCGSAMEVAATVILAAGIKAVIATSFARTFYRNAVNNGLVVVECDTAGISEGDRISVEMNAVDGTVTVRDQARDLVRAGLPVPAIMLAILQSGGLVEYIRRHGRFPLAV